jgi:hypothetical protein
LTIYNAHVKGVVHRAASGLLIVPFLAFCSALVPLHAHEPGSSARAHAVVHSHFEPHAAGAHHSAEPEVEPGAEHVIWLDAAIIHQTTYQLDPVPPPIPVHVELVPEELARALTAFEEAAPPHGPPRDAIYFRGPPTFLA